VPRAIRIYPWTGNVQPRASAVLYCAVQRRLT